MAGASSGGRSSLTGMPARRTLAAAGESARVLLIAVSVARTLQWGQRFGVAVSLSLFGRPSLAGRGKGSLGQLGGLGRLRQWW